MLTDEVFEREKMAYRIISERITEMIGEGYEIRMLEAPAVDRVTLHFIGPAAPGQASDVQTLHLPLQFLHLVIGGDPQAEQEWGMHVNKVKDANADMYSFIRGQIGKKLGEIGNDNDSGEGNGAKEYKA
jgi:hypothetical protein